MEREPLNPVFLRREKGRGKDWGQRGVITRQSNCGGGSGKGARKGKKSIEQ